LVIFPAGEVSSPHGMPPAIVDPEWNDRVLRLALAASAPVVPVHVSGRNSAAFQCAGFVHPMLRTALLNREMMNKRGLVVDVSVGRPIAPGRLKEVGEEGLTEYVRKRTYLLAERHAHVRPPFLKRNIRQERIADPVPAEKLASEVEALPASALLLRGSHYAVYIADAQSIPNILPEIGRLREVTFRSVGEGSGRAMDIDSFDSRYEHMFVWSEKKRELVGAYRIARVDDTLRRFGSGGLYTQRLFHLKPDFLHRVEKGLELGRSFVRQEYQRSLHPLYYLWKGIGAYLGRNPSYRFLFGPVSISNDYSRAARELIVQYFRGRRAESENIVRARKPFRPRPFGARFLSELAGRIDGVDELSDFIADLEPDGKGVPVLLRHYLGLGAEVLEFNVDPAFANALDALIVVDLTRSNPATLEKYMGSETMEKYLAFHRVTPH
jgi:putative hemolysin